MRILEVIEGLDSGGAERFVVDLSNELSKGNDVALGTLVEREGSDFYGNELSSNVYRFHHRLKKGRFLRIKQIISAFKIIRKFKPQIVHVHDRAFIPCILPSLVYPKIDFFYTVHNVANKDAGVGIGSKLRKFFLKRTIKPIAISNYCAITFKDYYGYEPYSIIENGCRPLCKTSEYEDVKAEVNLYKSNSQTKVFLNIARFFEQKNHELLIHSFNSLIEEGYDILLLIIGSSPDPQKRIYLESLVKDTTRIKFLGSKHNVQDYLFATDYFCLSSSWEGLPITILEAGLCGSFSISTPVGGVPDVINDINIGILSLDLSLNSYKEAIINAIKQTPNRIRIQKFYEDRYTMANCAIRYVETFQRR